MGEVEDAVDNRIAEILARCDDEGMVEPLIIFIGAADEYFEIWRLNADEEVKTLAKHDASPDGMIQLPINIMVVDKNGAALHAAIDGDGMKFH
jgi:hypothetical protein